MMQNKQFICAIGRVIWALSSRSHKSILHIKKILKISQRTNISAKEITSAEHTLKKRKTTLCIPEGIYKIGYGSHEAKVSNKQIQKSIINKAANFFDAPQQDIWYDFFCSQKNGANIIDHTWIATQKKHLAPFHDFMHAMKIANYHITIAPVVVSNALCWLAQQKLCHHSKTWLVFVDRNIYIIKIDNCRLKQLAVIPAKNNYIKSGIIYLNILYDYINQMARDYSSLGLREPILNQETTLCIIGKACYFYNKNPNKKIIIEEDAYTYLEKRIYFNENIGGLHLHKRSQLYLLMVGLSL